MTPRYTELQLDALRELANIASGNAATALSQMLGREVESERAARAGAAAGRCHRGVRQPG